MTSTSEIIHTEVEVNGIDSKHSSETAGTKAEVLRQRRELIGPTCRMFFDEDPLMISRGDGQYLFDENGVKYLDCISNVQHVGHAHPRVVAAVQKQMSLTNCNNRFLHPLFGACARRVLDTLPAQLDTFYACNSGSEANDLALRLAFDFTGGTEVIVIDHAYHGHLLSCMGISPYKFNHMGKAAKPAHVHVAPVPDIYSGIHRLPTSELESPDALAAIGERYALDVKAIVDRITADGKRPAAFILEALQSCGGQIMTPPHYLHDAAKYVREAGGVVILDEVQTGFGRVGTHFWAYQTHAPDFCPDIVCMGKPMGNGFPVSAVVTKRALGKVLGEGVVQYFNTFGGNPASMAAALAVMDVIRDECLMDKAVVVGAELITRLKALQLKHPAVVGHVRGMGLFAGVELVECSESRRPASRLASALVSRLRYRHAILLSTEGPNGNILKFKPPMCFTVENVHQVCVAIDECLTELQNCPKE